MVLEGRRQKRSRSPGWCLAAGGPAGPNPSSRAPLFSSLTKPGLRFWIWGAEAWGTSSNCNLQNPLHGIHSFPHLGIPVDILSCSPPPSNWALQSLYSRLLLGNVLCDGCVFHSQSGWGELHLAHLSPAGLPLGLPALSPLSFKHLCVWGQTLRGSQPTAAQTA